MKLLGFCAALGLWLFSAVGMHQTLCLQAFPTSSPGNTTFRVSSNLILMDVVALNSKSGIFDQSLSKDDFQVFDDDQSVPIRTFDSGPATRPLAVWFVLPCNEGDDKTLRSKISASDVPRFRPALDLLSQQDLLGVAHWCDDGKSEIDLLPTNNADDAIEAIKGVLAPTSGTRPSLHQGAFWATLHSVIDNTFALSPERFPLVILLDDKSTMPSWEAEYVVKRLLKTSTTIYAMQGRESSRRQTTWHNSQEVGTADCLANETGGQVISVAPSAYEAGLRSILYWAHSRYELGFTPTVLDGKRHSLYVTLSQTAKARHHGVPLRYCSQYFATGSEAL